MTSAEFHAALASGSPIEGADLSNIEWKDAQCAEAKFLRCRFIRCRFAHVDFRGATFEDCIFTDKAASTGTTFAFSELREARLIRCDLSFCHIDASCSRSRWIDATCSARASNTRTSVTHTGARSLRA